MSDRGLMAIAFNFKHSDRDAVTGLTMPFEDETAAFFDQRMQGKGSGLMAVNTPDFTQDLGLMDGWDLIPGSKGFRDYCEVRDVMGH